MFKGLTRFFLAKADRLHAARMSSKGSQWRVGPGTVPKMNLLITGCSELSVQQQQGTTRRDEQDKRSDEGQKTNTPPDD